MDIFNGSCVLKGIHGWVSVDTSVDTRLSLDQNLGRLLVEHCLIFADTPSSVDRYIPVSWHYAVCQATLTGVSIRCRSRFWSSVDLVLITCWSRYWSSVDQRLINGFDGHSTAYSTHVPLFLWNHKYAPCSSNTFFIVFHQWAFRTSGLRSSSSFPNVQTSFLQNVILPSTL